MSELFQAAVNAAEMAAVGEGGPAGERIAQLLASPADARSGNDEERAYLAVLLDFIGLREESARILQTPLGAGQADTSATLRNMEGMLAAAHGDYGRAQQILRAALQAAAGLSGSACEDRGEPGGRELGSRGAGGRGDMDRLRERPA